MDVAELDALEQRERLSELCACLDAQSLEEEAGLEGEEGEEGEVQTRRMDAEARARSLELRLNHATLQGAALRRHGQELADELDALRFAAVEAEETRMLLEARLGEVTAFEGLGGGGVAALQGELLAAANEQMRVAAAEGRLEREREQRQLWLLGETLAARDAELTAVSERAAALSDQLAQRTVLFSAQERRWREEGRASASAERELREECVGARARLQQLERQYAETDRARVEALLTCRQLEEQTARLEGELSGERERAAAADEELSAQLARALALQEMVDRLRGADLQDVERALAAEAEALRLRARRREEELGAQVEELRALLAGEATRRDRLLEELAEARGERDERGLLLASLDADLARGLSVGRPALRYAEAEAEERPDETEAAVGALLERLREVRVGSACVPRSRVGAGGCLERGAGVVWGGGCEGSGGGGGAAAAARRGGGGRRAGGRCAAAGARAGPLGRKRGRGLPAGPGGGRRAGGRRAGGAH